MGCGGTTGSPLSSRVSYVTFTVTLRGRALVVYEVPLLFEALIHHWIRPVILVACDIETQKSRLKGRDRLSDAEAQRHIEAQMSLEEKRKLADYTIENNGTLAELEAQVKAIVEKIEAT